MTILEYNFSICLSSKLIDVDSMCKLNLPEPARKSSANIKRDDHRIFWDFNASAGEQFEDGVARIIKWLHQHHDVLSEVADAEKTLWCTIHTADEFAGFAIDKTMMQSLSIENINLMISVYADKSV
jgi:hypothetical protein